MFWKAAIRVSSFKNLGSLPKLHVASGMYLLAVEELESSAIPWGYP